MAVVENKFQKLSANGAARASVGRARWGQRGGVRRLRRLGDKPPYQVARRVKDNAPYQLSEQIGVGAGAGEGQREDIAVDSVNQ